MTTQETQEQPPNQTMNSDSLKQQQEQTDQKSNELGTSTTGNWHYALNWQLK